MWEAESARAAGAPAEKYHGKWAFVRAAGVQEPASVLFSLGNMAVQAAGLARYARRLRRAGGAPAGGSGLGPLWVAHGALACNAWLWSAVFHSRDTAVTEQLDYFSAGALVAFGLLATLARVLRVRSRAGRVLLAMPIAALYFERVRLMRVTLFDYGMWTALCVAGGGLQAAAWLAWAATAGRRHPGRALLVGFLLAVHACLLLELFDFPPFWGVLDAHALWHLATVPLGLVWFEFLGRDLEAPEQQQRSKAV
jgi:hypothetical protein